jgi:2-polyprenyl-6-methoxyphenol hydroxylase-like FAD-dependent oxidoreductase
VNFHDVCIRGEGPVGRSLALALARQGLRVALVADASAATAAASAPPAPDVRTYALNAGSVALLQDLRVWDALPPDARTAVWDMRVQGDVPAGRRPAALHFSAYEQSVQALAWIVDAAELDAVLASAVRFAPHITVVAEAVQAPLTVVAEGKDAASRAALGVKVDTQAYGHSGVAARLRSDQPHAGLARQWFRSPDILALLPFDRPSPGHSYGLVWSVPHDRAQALLAMAPAEFEQALAQATGGEAGSLALEGPRAAWPLRLARAQSVSGPGWVLVGDAAHVVHPLAGQGLNLGLADVLALADVIAQREPWRGLGDEKLLRRYARRRHLPTLAMAGVTDALWHLFAQESPLWREARHRGLQWVDRLGPLKKALTARALNS